MIPGQPDDATNLLAMADHIHSRLARVVDDTNWPVLKVLQEVSPELHAPGSIYQAGDMLLPHWAVRVPHTLNLVIAGVDAFWERWKPRELGGGFLGRSAERPSEDSEGDATSVGVVYCLTADHGRFSIRFSGHRLRVFRLVLEASALVPDITDLAWYLEAVQDQVGRYNFWAAYLRSQRAAFGGFEVLRDRAKGFSA